MDVRTRGRSAPPPTPAGPAATDQDGLPLASPPVVAVVVAHDPGPWFERTLTSLRDQRYPALSVLVIDAGSTEDLNSRIAAVLPRAYVRRIDDNPGFGAAANEALSAVEGAPFLLLCHDDVALAPDVVQLLVEEAFRSNAAVVGPKLVAWDDPRQLRQVAASVDKTGVLAPFAEPGELDQEQHDAVRDVFVIPGACTLVRADLFRTLGGFDRGISYLGEDVDLCWRTHVVGGRVVVVPAARVRHLEALGQRRHRDDRRRLQARHRIRTMLSCYRLLTLVRVIPQALVLSVVEAGAALLAGDRRHAADVVAAWTWNLPRLVQVRRKRKALRRLRQVGDGEVRELQVRGSARLTAYLRGQIGRRDDRLSAMTRSGREFAGDLRSQSTRAAMVIGAAALALVAVGSRNLAFAPLPNVGELVALPPGPGPLVRQWLSGWRDVGVGRGGPSPTGLGLVGGLGYVFLGAMGQLQKALVVGMLPVGAAGAWRLARPIGSVRAAVAALVVYLALPVPYNAIAKGAWSGLLLYGAAPWILLLLARVSRLAPYGRRDLRPGSPEAAATPPTRSVRTNVLRLGLVLAVVGALVPAAIPVAGVAGLAMVLGTLVAGRTAGTGRLLVGVGAAALLAAVLLLPWSITPFMEGGGWRLVAGVQAGAGGRFAVGDLLRFETGPFGAPPVGWAFLAPAALPLVIGRGWRFDWAVRSWAVALAGWGLLWTGQQGWSPVALPAHEVLLAPAAAALALSAALGMAAFEVDLPGYRFGWRQAVSAIAALGLVVAIVPLTSGIVDGRWRIPDGGLSDPVGRILEEDAAPSRLLWLGSPDVVPAGGAQLDDQAVWSVTDGTPALRDRWPAPLGLGDRVVADALGSARDRRTAHLGQLLAPTGVRYVVVPLRTTPVAFEGDVHPPPDWVLDTLAGQLDLERVSSDSSLVVYRNAAWRPLLAAVPDDGRARSGPTDALGDDPANWPGVLERMDESTWRGALDEPARLALAAPADDGWELRVDGDEAAPGRIYGWAQRFEAGEPGRAEVAYRTPLPLRAALIAQVVAWLLVLLLVRRTTGQPLAREERA